MSRRGDCPTIEGERLRNEPGSLEVPRRRWEVRPGRHVLQSKGSMGDHPPRIFIVRVVVDVDRRLNEVVAAYRTSKMEKYWRSES